MAKLSDILAQLSRDVETGEHRDKDDETTGDTIEVVEIPKGGGQRLADIIADPMSKPFGWQTAAPDESDFFGRGDPVADSADLQRILALPRRTPFDLLSPETKAAIVELEMQKHGRPNASCRCKQIDPRKSCLKTLLPIQAWALREISIAQGLLASIPVGSGKCVHPDTEVMDYSTGRRRKVSDVGALDVATFDKTLSVAPATAFPSGSKSCVEVRLRDGSSLKLSTDHPVLTARGWVHAAELRETDYAAVAIEMPELANPILTTDDEVKFVAYMLSDGGCSQAQLSFTSASDCLIADFKSAASVCGFSLVERESSSKAREFRVNKGCEAPNKGGMLRERWGLHGLAKDKRAHADIWGLPRRQVALFLNRFWACDGHVASSHLEITLASEKLIDDLRFLLTRLGVRSAKHYKVSSYVKDGVRHNFDAWRLHIAGAAALKFLNEVGDVLGKEQACAAYRTKLETTPRNTNYDVVPIGLPEIYEMFDELGYPPRGQVAKGAGHRTELMDFLGGTKDQFISRGKFLEFVRRTGYAGKYAHLATTDVAWERVVDVEHIGVHEVYDLNVPGTHNFVANGVVIHNTLIASVGAMALTNVRSVLLLIPASLRKQIQYDFLMISEHFKTPNIRLHFGDEKPVLTMPAHDTSKPTLHVFPYSRLSLPDSSAFIENLNPDAIIADECDALKSMTSSRGMRIAKWYAGGTTPEEKRKRQGTKFVGMTGSLTDHSITEMNFPSLFALKEKSPLPLDPTTVEEWAGCLDAGTSPRPPGRLMDFCEDGENVRAGYARRLAETPGFIITGENIITVAGTPEGSPVIEVMLDIRERTAPDLPEVVANALASVRQGQRPDYLIPGADPGDIEELEDAMAIAQCAQQVSCGVLYFQRFPRGEPVSLIKEWKAKGRAYRSEVRELALQGHTYLDSEFLCRQAAMRYWGHADKRDDRPEWRCESWPAWHAIMKKVEPEPASHIIDNFLCQDIAEFAEERPSILWYTMKAIALEVKRLTGLPLHDGGSKAEERLRAEKGDRSIICSIPSNGRGRDGLQLVFDRQLIINPPASATMIEQILGRAHRRGQRSRVVETQIYMQTPEVKKAYIQAVRRSEYVRDIMKSQPKLLKGWQES